jgi:hypothetical protein
MDNKNGPSKLVTHVVEQHVAVVRQIGLRDVDPDREAKVVYSKRQELS